MEHELNFFIQFIKNLSLDIKILDIDEDIHSSFDLGFRETFFASSDYSNFRTYINEYIKEKTIYYITDSFYCKYILFLLKNGENTKVYVIGPYKNIEISKEMILNLMEDYEIPVALEGSLEKYYGMLAYIQNEGYLHALLHTLANCIWGNSSNYDVACITQNRFEEKYLLSNTSDNIPATSAADIKRIEKTYKTENELLHIVSLGQIHKLDQYLELPSMHIEMEKRNPDPLRNQKNYLIITNSLLRKTVENSGVHPIYIDDISRNFALKIEEIRSLAQGKTLMNSMIRKYCLLVHNHSTRNYSQLVRDIIVKVDSDLTADLTLNALASELNVNASYLSSLFKKETSQTLTTYVNQKRVQYAIQLLNTTTLQIQTIAEHCGIPDLNYFTKIFKKFIGMTPSQYRQTIQIKQ